MIRSIAVILFLFHFSIYLSAQSGDNVKGIFKTGKDFSEGKFLYIIDCRAGKNKILLNDFFDKKYVTVKADGASDKVLKNDIYGYQTCNGKIYRFLGKKELYLLNQKNEILIYKWLLPKKVSDGKTNVTNYYFSNGNEGMVQKLTIKNLKNAFNQNAKFLSLIDRNFKYNSELGEFDEATQLYKINSLLKEAENK